MAGLQCLFIAIPTIGVFDIVAFLRISNKNITDDTQKTEAIPLYGGIIMKNVAITENHLYSKAYTKGKKFSGRLCAVFVLKDYSAKRLMKANPQKEFVNRIGLSVGKKFGKATQRVRAKRIVRQAYRNIERDEKERLKKGFLIVIAIRDGCHGAKSFEVEKELRYAFDRLDMFKQAQKDPKEQGTCAPLTGL